MKEQCPICKGTGVMTDVNGIQYDEPCDNCIGTGIIYMMDEIVRYEDEVK